MACFLLITLLFGGDARTTGKVFRRQLLSVTPMYEYNHDWAQSSRPCQLSASIDPVINAWLQRRRQPRCTINSRGGMHHVRQNIISGGLGKSGRGRTLLRRRTGDVPEGRRRPWGRPRWRRRRRGALQLGRRPRAFTRSVTGRRSSPQHGEQFPWFKRKLVTSIAIVISIAIETSLATEISLEATVISGLAGALVGLVGSLGLGRLLVWQRLVLPLR